MDGRAARGGPHQGETAPRHGANPGGLQGHPRRAGRLTATPPRSRLPRRGFLLSLRMRRTLRNLRIFFETNPYTAGATHQLSTKTRALIFIYRLALRILAQWARDKCPQQAAALAFQTALSLVPVTAIAFSLLRATGSLDVESRLS